MKRRAWMILVLAVRLGARPVRGARYRVTQTGRNAKDRNAAAQEAGPVVFDLIAEERWPIRGLDPVLHVGEMEMDSYQYANAENTILRFTCYEPGKLQEGAKVFLQYGQDLNSRTDLAPFSWANVSAG